ALPARAAPASAQAAAPRPPPAATRGSAASRSGRRAIPPLAAARPRAPRSAPRTRSLPGKRDRRAACGPDGETAAPPSGSRAPPRATTDQEPARASASPPPRPPYADDGGRLRRREAGPFIPLAAPVPSNGGWDRPLRGQSLLSGLTNSPAAAFSPIAFSLPSTRTVNCPAAGSAVWSRSSVPG